MDNGRNLARLEDLLVIIILLLGSALGLGVGLVISHALGGFQ